MTDQVSPALEPPEPADGRGDAVSPAAAVRVASGDSTDPASAGGDPGPHDEGLDSESLDTMGHGSPLSLRPLPPEELVDRLAAEGHWQQICEEISLYGSIAHPYTD